MRRSRAKTIKKNTNSTQNKSQTHRAKQYEVMSFLSTDCELSAETCSKNVYSLGPRTKEIRATAGVANIGETMRLRWLGRVETREDVEIRTWKMEVGEHRKTGRPKTLYEKHEGDRS